MLIDSHAHILYEDKLDSGKIISSMSDDGLEAIVNVGTDLESSKKAVEFAEKNDGIYAIVGVHPDSVQGVTRETIIELERLAQSDKVVAIGEIGLDYHYEPCDKTQQRRIFEEMLELAARLDLPVCIHSRDAIDDMFEILSKHAGALKRKGVLHCYGDGEKYAEKYMELGFFISFAGNVTFKKYDRSFLQALNPNQILVETDCPFLSPEPIRGSVNEPKNVRITAEFLAREFNMSMSEFEKMTTENTKRIYYKIK